MSETATDNSRDVQATDNSRDVQATDEPSHCVKMSAQEAEYEMRQETEKATLELGKMMVLKKIKEETEKKEHAKILQMVRLLENYNFGEFGTSYMTDRKYAKIGKGLIKMVKASAGLRKKTDAKVIELSAQVEALELEVLELEDRLCDAGEETYKANKDCKKARAAQMSYAKVVQSQSQHIIDLEKELKKSYSPIQHHLELFAVMVMFFATKMFIDAF